ncbi:WD repeat-containing protein 78-like isoform X1 [Sitophilus oryzae]|uniref:Dynein axonemal intermediate chain 4 n=1 Tax=Sitophilus oryzae TaxID=7048 RepID=A0A6J2YCX8_SITOR|nr:WD repeat-containing protein 78-like isoform X1 [Sitophilus oryzae]
MTETKDTFQLTRKPLPTIRPKTILRSKSVAVNVIYEGKNVTPRHLNPNIYSMGKERQITVYDESSLSGKASGTVVTLPSDTTKTSLRFKTEMQTGTTFQGSIFHGTYGFLEQLAQADLTESTGQPSTRTESDVFPSSVSLSDKMQRTPAHVSLVLSETDTFMILDMPSCTAVKDSEEGILVDEKNKEYEFLTEGKGRNRKVVNAEAQTVQILKKSRNTLAEVVKTHDRHAFASNWEMYDTYHDNVNAVSDESEDSDKSEEFDFNVDLKETTGSVDSFRMSTEEKQLLRLMKNPRFQEAVCVIERLLANNCYNEQQKRFRGLSDPDDFREDIEYKYRLNLLWTFANSSTTGRCVTCLEWNPTHEDLLAVGYGKFYFADICTGMVMVWNIKNPVQPERVYEFADPVTTLSFSKRNPNLLAVGFYNGHVIVINVSNRELQIVSENTPSFEAVWCVVWRISFDESREKEQVCASSDDGRVIFYTVENTLELQTQQMMRVAKADGKLKGYNSMRKCSNLSIPVSRYAGARFIRWHPVDPNIYLVGTNEGVVHKCSTNYLNQHLDLFLTHDGPINELKYSPFTDKIYASCGDDWHLRIWAEGISEPLHELFVSMLSVQAMDWSPTHSTILATVYGKTILLWDFQRKVWKPQSETQSPSNSRNTIVQFTRSGRCLVVGDVEGNVHVFSLEDMPFPAFFQENLLFEALQKSLTTHPDLVDKLKKLRKSGTTGSVDDKHKS